MSSPVRSPPAETGFERALNAFLQRLTDSERRDFRATTVNDLKLEILAVQRKQREARSMANMRRVKGFVEAMEQFGKVIEVFPNTPNALAFVWGPMKTILLTASTWFESLDAILDAYQSISENLPIFTAYQESFLRSENMQRVLEMIWAVILDFHKQALRILKQNLMKQVFRPMWKDFRSRFKPMLDDLKRLKDLVESQATQLHIGQYEQDRAVFLANFKALEQQNKHNRFMDVLKWISAASADQDYERHQRVLKELNESAGKRSGQWILENEELESWLSSGLPKSSILWVNGIPGAGKSVLSSVIIKELKEKKLGSLAFFYCRYKDPDRNTALSILSSILGQLLGFHRDHVSFCYEECLAKGGVRLLSLDLCKKLLGVIVRNAPKTSIVVDGLDECEEDQRKLFLEYMTDLIGKCDNHDAGSLRLAVFSRDEPDIRKRLAVGRSISIMREDVGRDIETYVAHHSRLLQQKWERLSDDDREFIKKHVSDRADGMFLFAELVMKNLISQRTFEGLVNEISFNNLPGRGDLKKAYERTLCRIMDNASTTDKKATRNILSFMICCRRPLKWHEIQAAVSIDVESQVLDPDRRHHGSAHEIFGSLVVVLPGDRVEFVHQTAEDNLVDNPEVTRISALSAEHCMTLLCLEYLTFECFEEEYEPHDAGADGQFALQDYAAAHWADHVARLARIAQASPAGVVGVTLAPEEIHQMEEAIGAFVHRFGPELRETGGVNQPWAPSKDSLRLPADFDTIWRGVEWMETLKGDAVDEIFPHSLGAAVRRNRLALENMVDSWRDAAMLAKQYGGKLFKCSKRTCYYFHEGFDTKNRRGDHEKRHTAWFLCTELDCDRAKVGFYDAKELAKHQRREHPGHGKMSSSFPRLKKAPARKPAELKFHCKYTGCEARFSRQWYLRAHVRLHVLNESSQPIKAHEQVGDVGMGAALEVRDRDAMGLMRVDLESTSMDRRSH